MDYKSPWGVRTPCLTWSPTLLLPYAAFYCILLNPKQTWAGLASLAGGPWLIQPSSSTFHYAILEPKQAWARLDSPTGLAFIWVGMPGYIALKVAVLHVVGCLETYQIACYSLGTLVQSPNEGPVPTKGQGQGASDSLAMHQVMKPPTQLQHTQ